VESKGMARKDCGGEEMKRMLICIGTFTVAAVFGRPEQNERRYRR